MVVTGRRNGCDIADGERPPAPCPDCEAAAALLGLVHRIACSRVLMEHQLWEATRLLQEAGLLAEDLRHDGHFRRAMDARRFGVAIATLAAGCSPVLVAEEPRSAMQPWRQACEGRPSHPDPHASALLRLLIAACRQEAVR